MNIRMGMLKQLRPMRSSPLLQQAIFWPLPHLGELSWAPTLTSVFLSEAPWGAAKATAATEAMRRDLKKAILVDWVFWWRVLVKKRVWVLLGWIDCLK